MRCSIYGFIVAGIVLYIEDIDEISILRSCSSTSVLLAHAGKETMACTFRFLVETRVHIAIEHVHTPRKSTWRVNTGKHILYTYIQVACMLLGLGTVVVHPHACT